MAARYTLSRADFSFPTRLRAGNDEQYEWWIYWHLFSFASSIGEHEFLQHPEVLDSSRYRWMHAGHRHANCSLRVITRYNVWYTMNEYPRAYGNIDQHQWKEAVVTFLFTDLRCTTKVPAICDFFGNDRWYSDHYRVLSASRSKIETGS